MTTKKKKAALNGKSFPSMLPEYLLLCENVLRSYSTDSLSIINIMDSLIVKSLPCEIQSLWMVASFLRSPKLDRKDFDALNMSHSVRLITPKGKVVDLGTYPVDLSNRSNPFLYRLVIDFSDALQLTSEGPYTLEVQQAEEGCEAEVVMHCLLPVHTRSEDDAS